MRKKTLLFSLAVLVQLVLVGMVPVNHYAPLVTGRPIYLKLAPVDPYNPFYGYYMILSYEIASVDRTDVTVTEPAAETQESDEAAVEPPAEPAGTIPPDEFVPPDIPYEAVVYVIVKKADDGFWHRKTVTLDRPADLAEDEVLLKGINYYGRISFGIEQLYVPEETRLRIETDLRDNLDKARALVKVDSRGNAALVQVEVEGRIYGAW